MLESIWLYVNPLKFRMKAIVFYHFNPLPLRPVKNKS
jgi:hypothetical protein